MRTVTLIFVLLVSVTAAMAEEATPPEVAFAQRVIVGELMLAKAVRSPSVRRPCESSAELAVALLGLGGEKSEAGLLSLLALRLDGAASESFHCYVANRGKSFVRVLETYDSHKAARWCVSMFESVRRRELRDLGAVRVEEVCRTKDEIDEERARVIEALEAGGRCEE